MSNEDVLALAAVKGWVERESRADKDAKVYAAVIDLLDTLFDDEDLSDDEILKVKFARAMLEEVRHNIRKRRVA